MKHPPISVTIDSVNTNSGEFARYTVLIGGHTYTYGYDLSSNMEDSAKGARKSARAIVRGLRRLMRQAIETKAVWNDELKLAEQEDEEA